MSAILAALFAILIGIVAIIPYLNYENQSLETIRAANTASQFRQIIDATRLYLQDNYSALNGTVQATSNNPPNCQVGVPCNIPFSDLQPNYLSNTLADVTPYNQTWQIEVLLTNNGSATNGLGMQVLLFTSGGFNIPAPKLAMIAAETGQEAGFIPYPGQNNASTQVNLPSYCNPNTPYNKSYSSYQAEAIGAYGHWNLPSLSPYTGSFCPGHLAALIYFSPDEMRAGDYLYRVGIPGQANLNEMETDLNMGNNSLTNATSLQTTNQSDTNTTSILSSNTQSSSTISSTAQSPGSNQIAMTTTNNQSSASISAAAAGGANQIALTATNNQASLAVQGTSNSANYLTIVSTQETPGTSCSSNQIGNIAPDSDNSGTPLACITTSPYGAASWQKMIGFTSTSLTPQQSNQTYGSGVTNTSGGTEFVSVTCPQTPQVEILVNSNNYLPPITISGVGFASAMIPANYEFQIMTNPLYSLYQCSILTTH